LLYFIGGYLLYAALFAAFGSAVDQPSDASQFTLPVMMILIFALYAGMYSIDNPDGPLAWWCSIIPFTSPIVMMVRLPYDVPAWEVALSLALLFFTALGTVYLAGRIYRTGILMYGKKISFREILKWVK
jgi:ABC-2 type transport system permease protein